MHDGDQQITFNLEKAGNQEMRVIIIHCSGKGIIILKTAISG